MTYSQGQKLKAKAFNHPTRAENTHLISKVWQPGRIGNELHFDRFCLYIDLLLITYKLLLIYYELIS